MLWTPVIYHVASVAAGRRLLRGLGELFPSRPLEPSHRRATLFDTFDWRVAHDDGMLTTEAGEPTFLVWSSMNGTIRHRTPVSAVPAFARDLPRGPLRRGLEPVIKMRRLSPIATLDLAVRGLEIVDDLDKTVCRISFENGTVAPGDGSSAATGFGPVLRVTPIKGYRNAFQDVVRRLDAKLGSARSPISELQRICTAVGREPCSAPLKQTYDIRAGMRACDAMKAIHRALLDTLRRNESGMRQDLDSEFLHDARVAVRRTRSALTQVTGVLAVDEVQRFKTEFRWLGGVTGPTRDLDVYLLKVPAYRAALDEEHRAALEPLVDLLRERQQAAHRQLVADLDTPRYARLLDDWSTLLNTPTPAASDLPNAMRPIDAVASERIWRAWRKTIKRGREIGDDSPVELLHRLRIDCKKLRYLLEFFSSLYDKQEVKRLVDALKQLQDNLGDLNDLAIQVDALRGFERELERRGTQRATLESIEQLISLLERRRIDEREQFAKHFADFSSNQVVASFRRLFRRQVDGPR